MAAMSRGTSSKAPKPAKVVKPQRAAKRTASGRKHHWEPFSQRVARLKIDPVRRTRRDVTLDGDEDVQKEASYFQTSLLEWKDLNLSENFTFFYKEIAPLTESLPMVLHYDGRIMDILVRYIEKQDSHSLEPLLSLLAHFAHDLDARFEKHFQRAVAAVGQVAAKHSDVAVIEWSFSCLAWLFKYLSRLLVPDLCPLYDLMAPLLGKQRQKPFVIRFAAESMSFLVRKAGVMYEKKKEPLESVVRHMVQDFHTTATSHSSELYAQGLMTLFTESVKGVQHTLHSGGSAVLRSLIDLCFQEADTGLSSSALQLLTGSLISVVHYTTPETFAPALDILLQTTNIDFSACEPQRIGAANQLLFTVVTTRKGARITQWPAVLKTVVRMIEAIDKVATPVPERMEPAILNTLAVILQSAPLDLVLPQLGVLDILVKTRWKDCFLPFCYLFAELGHEKFQTLLLSHFQRFVITHWQDKEVVLCALLPKLSKTGVLTDKAIPCPTQWQKKIVSDFDKLSREQGQSEIDDIFPLLCNGDLAASRHMRTDASVTEVLNRDLLQVLRNSANSAQQHAQDQTLTATFALGQGFLHLAQSSTNSMMSGDLLKDVCGAAAQCKNLLPYWNALHASLQHVEDGQTSSRESLEALLPTLIDLLSSPAHDLRYITLQVLETVISKTRGAVPELLQIALSIESTPPTMQSARVISSQLRKLAIGYKDILSDPVLAKAIPTFCFGLLHLRLAQAWDDAIQALKDMSQFSQAEEVIFAITADWFKGEPNHEELPSTGENTETGFKRVISDFECSNLQQVESTCRRCQIAFDDPEDMLRKRFESDHARTPLSDNADRTQALRVLLAMPQLAEKRSRLLVPVLLEWAGEDAASSHTLTAEDETPLRWTRKDQKLMLDVFAKFQNPKVLYRSADVYRALLGLLSNGDAEIQRSALSAVLSWKAPEVNRHQEHLRNLLDDARFREEVSVFLRLDQEDAISAEDCPVLMPVLLRLLYGKAVARAGSASGRRGQETRRKAIFVALARFPTGVLEQFIDLALGSTGTLDLVRDGSLQRSAILDFSVHPRKQAGMLNMIEDMLDVLGEELQPFAIKLANSVLVCLLKASMSTSSDDTNAAPQDTHVSLDRSIRQSGLHCIVQLFTSCPDVAWYDHVRIIMDELIGPRLEKLPIETAQSVSGTLRLFSTWSGSLAMAPFLVDLFPQTLQRVADCLGTASAKDEVKLFIVEHILGKLLDLVQLQTSSSHDDAMDVYSASAAHVQTSILEPNATFFVSRIGAILQQNPPKELLDACVACISRLAPLVKSEEDIKSVIDVASNLLRQPSRRVTPATKKDLLQTLCHLIPAANLSPDRDRFDEVYRTLCPLFAFFRDRESRILLSQAMAELVGHDEDLAKVAALCEDLNSYSATRLDEPDFVRRSQAFTTINEDDYMAFSAAQWRPLVYNMLFHIRDDEELAIRTSASFSLRRFAQSAKSAAEEEVFKNLQFQDIVSNALLPGLQNGMREQSELVRSEFLSVTAELIKQMPSWPAVGDMQSLLANDDDEASFFTNILHIQQHRRLRALRRLAGDAKTGVISSANVSHFFIPLLEHFIFDAAADESAHNLAAETIHSLGALTEALDWPQYRATLTRFISYIKTKPDLEKTVLRLVSSVIDGLHRASQHQVPDADAMVAVAADGVAETEPAEISRLRQTMPSQQKLAEGVNRHFLPPLVAYLHLKDESTVSLRVPVAIAVVKLLKVLPPDEMTQRLPSVLMDVSHILRSRDQGARDMTRKTLAEISALLGPNYFGFMLKELRSALQRGYQLHVLSFTVHSILVENSALLKPGDLDFCLPGIVSVIMDDIFGVTGQEKDAEEYISKMKEVKSSKSFDSMELIAKSATLAHLSDLIRPLHTLLLEKLDLKTVKKIDELLRRIGLGTTQNPAVNDRDILVFCYEVAKQAVTSAAEPVAQRGMDDYKTRKYLIQMKGAKASGNSAATSSYLFKLVRFALDLMRSVLQRHDDLKTPANLTGFLPIVGDALVGGHEEVRLAAVRLMTSIIKVPIPRIESDAPVYAAEAVAMIRAAPSTTTELAQAALKLVSAILRERQTVKIRETDLAYVLKRMKPDLEEPDRQGVIFNFLKAVLSRKIVITEVYEVLDTVAAIMVTNQTRTARDLARGTFFQFIMEYPQAKDRLAKQIGFLVKNLEYQYLEGRQSVLELVHLLLSKTHGDLVQDLSSQLFVPVVMVLVNDDSPDCREMASVLISKMLERSDQERRKQYLSLLRTWLEQDQQQLLRRVALQCWTMYLAVGQPQVKEVSFLMKMIAEVLPSEDRIVAADDWELLYYALQTFAKITETAASTALSERAKSLWSGVFRSLQFPHAWVKLSAARLLGALFADTASSTSQDGHGLATLPMKGSGGLLLSGDALRRLCSSSLKVLDFTGVTEQLAAQSARNLVFLGRCFSANGLTWGQQPVNGDGTSDAEESDNGSDEDEEEATAKEPTTALSHLFNRLSTTLRRDLPTMRAPSLYPKTATLQAIAALSNALPISTLSPSLETILLPLVHLTDPSIPAPFSVDPAFNDAYKAYTGLAAEVMELLQKRLGTGEYVAVMGRVQRTVRERREGRRVKRRIERVSMPERAAVEKKRRYEGKKARRKEKSSEARGRRRGW